MKQLKSELNLNENITAVCLGKNFNEKDLPKIKEFTRSGNKELLIGLDVLEVKEKHNIIPTVGRTVLARLLAGDTTYTGEVNYGAIGSGNTPFTNASTQLNTEVYRKLAASQSFDNNIAYIDFFIASGDVADGTYEEWGTFIDGTGSANSGQAFSLVVLEINKNGSVYISAKYTIS